jgi:hypothetical protein
MRNPDVVTGYRFMESRLLQTQRETDNFITVILPYYNQMHGTENVEVKVKTNAGKKTAYIYVKTDVLARNPSGSVRPGDIFYASWGYDQTNIDFMKVISVSPSGKTVICQMLSKKYVEQNGPSGDRVVPGEPFGITFRMQVRPGSKFNNSSVSLVGSYPYVQGEYGASMHRKMVFPYAGRSMYQTDSMFGHNPMVKVSQLAITAKKKFQDDIKAGHKDGAEYWAGAAGHAFLLSNPSEPRKSSSFGTKDLYWRTVWSPTKKEAEFQGQAALKLGWKVRYTQYGGGYYLWVHMQQVTRRADMNPLSTGGSEGASAMVQGAEDARNYRGNRKAFQTYKGLYDEAYSQEYHRMRGQRWCRGVVRDCSCTKSCWDKNPGYPEHTQAVHWAVAGKTGERAFCGLKGRHMPYWQGSKDLSKVTCKDCLKKFGVRNPILETLGAGLITGLGVGSGYILSKKLLDPNSGKKKK